MLEDEAHRHVHQDLLAGVIKAHGDGAQPRVLHDHGPREEEKGHE